MKMRSLDSPKESCDYATGTSKATKYTEFPRKSAHEPATVREQTKQKGDHRGHTSSTSSSTDRGMANAQSNLACKVVPLAAFEPATQA
jgi:hypothetical protein